MKKSIISLLLVVLMLSSTTLSYASTVPIENNYNEKVVKKLESSEQVATYIETVIGKNNLNKHIIEDKYDYLASGTDCEIAIPKNSSNYVSMKTGAGDINMKLPIEVSNAKGHISENGTVVYNSKDKNVSVAVQALSEEQNGVLFDALRTMVTIENADAPKEYGFDFDLPQGYRLISDYDYVDEYDEWDCGQVFIVDKNNEIVSTIEPAWAKDANGNDIATDYRIVGNTLIQNVAFDKNSTFPIIADPTSHPTKYTHYYTDYPTLKDIVNRGYESCQTAGVNFAFGVLALVPKTATGIAAVTMMLNVADVWSAAQFYRVKAKFDEMTPSQWLKTTYTHTWRNGGKNSGYVRSSTPELKIVNNKGD